MQVSVITYAMSVVKPRRELWSYDLRLRRDDARFCDEGHDRGVRSDTTFVPNPTVLERKRCRGLRIGDGGPGYCMTLKFKQAATVATGWLPGAPLLNRITLSWVEQKFRTPVLL